MSDRERDSVRNSEQNLLDAGGGGKSRFADTSDVSYSASPFKSIIQMLQRSNPISAYNGDQRRLEAGGGRKSRFAATADASCSAGPFKSIIQMLQ